MAKRTTGARGGLLLAAAAVLGAGGAAVAVVRRRRSGDGRPEPGVPVAPAAPGSEPPPPVPMPTAADFPPEEPSNAVKNFEEATVPVPDGDETR